MARFGRLSSKRRKKRKTTQNMKKKKREGERKREGEVNKILTCSRLGRGNFKESLMSSIYDEELYAVWEYGRFVVVDCPDANLHSHPFEQRIRHLLAHYNNEAQALAISFPLSHPHVFSLFVLFCFASSL